METQIVNFDVGNESLIMIVIKWMLQSRPARAPPCDICGGQSDTYTGSSPSTLIFPCQYQSISAPYAFYINSTFIRRTSGRNLGTFKQSNDF
jgi:hypothetical protein